MSAFDFSTPEIPYNGTQGYMQLVFDVEPNVDGNYACYPLMIFFCDNSNSPYPAYMYLTYRGFEYFSQNGTDYNSVYQYIDDFLSGGVGTPVCNEYSNGGGDASIGFQYNGLVDIVNYYTTDYFDYRIEESLRAQYYNYESQYNIVYSQLQSLQIEFSNTQTLLNDTRTALNNVVTEYNNLQVDYSDLQLSFEQLEQRYNDLVIEYNELETLFNSMVSDYNDSIVILNTQIEELQLSVENLTNDLIFAGEEISRLLLANSDEYMKGYTQAFEDYNMFDEGLYSIFSAPFTIVHELSQIEVFGFSIVRIVGIILLFVILSFILAFIWKVVPLL